MSNQQGDGSWTVTLLRPIKDREQTLSEIKLAPFKLDHTLRWRDGHFPSAIALLAHLTGLPEATLRELTYPDVDAVFFAFIAHVSKEVGNDITDNRVPIPKEPVSPWPAAELEEPQLQPQPQPQEPQPEEPQGDSGYGYDMNS